jgi:hypothetical protein
MIKKTALVIVKLAGQNIHRKAGEIKQSGNTGKRKRKSGTPSEKESSKNQMPFIKTGAYPG